MDILIEDGVAVDMISTNTIAMVADYLLQDCVQERRVGGSVVQQGMQEQINLI